MAALPIAPASLAPATPQGITGLPGGIQGGVPQDGGDPFTAILAGLVAPHEFEVPAPIEAQPATRSTVDAASDLTAAGLITQGMPVPPPTQSPILTADPARSFLGQVQAPIPDRVPTSQVVPDTALPLPPPIQPTGDVQPLQPVAVPGTTAPLVPNPITATTVELVQPDRRNPNRIPATGAEQSSLDTMVEPAQDASSAATVTIPPTMPAPKPSRDGPRGSQPEIDAPGHTTATPAPGSVPTPVSERVRIGRQAVPLQDEPRVAGHAATPEPAVPAVPPQPQAISTAPTAPTPVEAPAQPQRPQEAANPMERMVAGQVSRAVLQRSAEGDRRLVVRLTPPELGTVRIELIERGGQMTAHIHAEDPAVHQALDRMLPQMRSDLRQADGPVTAVVLGDGSRSAWSGTGQGGNTPRDQGRPGDDDANRIRSPRGNRGPRFSMDMDVSPVPTATPTAVPLGGRVDVLGVNAVA